MYELDRRQQQQLQTAFSVAEQFLEKTYVSQLTNYEVQQVPKDVLDFSVRQNLRLMKIDKIVYDKNEDISEKLVTVMNAVGHMDSAITLLLNSNGRELDLYIGVKSDKVFSGQEALEKSFSGNFPGTTFSKVRNQEATDLLEHIVNGRGINRTVAAVTGIPGLKATTQENYVQGLEKLIDAMRGEAFSAMFIADPVAHDELVSMKRNYEELYSSLVPFASSELTAGQNESQSIAKTISEGMTNTVNDSVAKAKGHTTGKSSSHSENRSKSTNSGVNAGIIFAGLNVGSSESKGQTRTNTVNFSDTFNTTRTEGSSRSVSSTKTAGDTTTEGTSKALQLHFENKTVQDLLTRIDKQLLRIQTSEDLGMWHFASYFFADDEQTAHVAASNYQSIIRGQQSALEGSSINIWTPDNLQHRKVREYLSHMNHPQFKQSQQALLHVSSGALINTRELAIAYGLPRKSVKGIPVLEMVEFGRNVHTLDQQAQDKEKLALGHIYNMGMTEQDNAVQLDVESLSMHTFITGSTGSGKSNTVYQLLNELLRKNKKFLVIEPAKGEYKNVFGGLAHVQVFGTNPNYSALLQINPFKFPQGIHVLEHIERLIEILNVCWPLYAAMPAVLKEAIEYIYEEAGWDLENSLHFETRPTYPTMLQLVDVLPKVIEQSGYSEEVKSNYIGALVTRVKSLTNGLTGKILGGSEVDNTLLFDGNCIVDLSRVGSSETKSLLMGVLFMRLQEHRMANATSMNEPLKHVTVLEEAHHLLRATPMAGGEGASLQGKSVEMLTNAIAEMRTYGEGFIIVDQSPNLLDPSAIRNTNTKMIMRLPDGGDRAYVGAAASLNDQQLNEIPRLETGVAVVYQNNWLQPVLCKVNSFTEQHPQVYHYDEREKMKAERQQTTLLMKLLLDNELTNVEVMTEQMILDCNEVVFNSHLPSYLKGQIHENFHEFLTSGTLIYWQKDAFETRAELISKWLGGDKLLRYARVSTNIAQFDDKLRRVLARYMEAKEHKLLTLVCQNILYYESLKGPEQLAFYEKWHALKKDEVNKY